VLTAALAACYQHIPVGHIEAGLRSFDSNNPFPEEINRTLVGFLADLHFAPTESAKQNLLRASVPANRILVTGNTVVDAVQSMHNRPDFDDPQLQHIVSLPGRLIVITIHRRENHGPPLRVRQIMRWARGHNESLVRYLFPLLRGRVPRGFWQRVDAVMLLGIYMVAPLIAAAWLLALVLFYLGDVPMESIVVALSVALFSTFGNAAAFFEVAAATRLDGSHARCRLLPFLACAFLVSLVTVTRSLFPDEMFHFAERELVWDKTRRFGRQPARRELAWKKRHRLERRLAKRELVWDKTHRFERRRS
jgi:hypothetical protein